MAETTVKTATNGILQNGRATKNENIAEIIERLEVNPENSKRQKYLSWEEYFMTVAKAAAMRSKDPATQVGCVLVNKDNIIVGTGYNGFPTGISDDDLPWSKESEDPMENKYAYVVHAEVNAILNSSDKSEVHGSRLFTTRFPCNECTKLIIQSKINEIIYLEDKDQWQSRAARRMLEKVGIPTRQYLKTGRQIVIEL